jgi:hypothetical protein
LPLLQIGLGPDAPRVLQEVACKAQDAFDVKVVDARLVELQFRECQFFRNPISLPLVRTAVDRSLENECLLQSGQLATKVRDPGE